MVARNTLWRLIVKFSGSSPHQHDPRDRAGGGWILWSDSPCGNAEPTHSSKQSATPTLSWYPSPWCQRQVRQRSGFSDPMYLILGKLMSIGHFWPATQILTLLRCSLPTPDTLPPGWYLKCNSFEGGEVLLSDRLADGSYSIDADPECFMVIINFLQVGWFLISSVYLYFLQYDRVILPSLGGPTIEDIGFVANQLALGPEISLQVGLPFRVGGILLFNNHPTQ